MSVPKFLQPYLASYDLDELDEKSQAVKKEIISQVLNLGDERAVCWLFGRYSRREIKDAVRQPQRGVWFPESLDYWQKILGVKSKASEREEAILRLNP